jgi:hypothetical protein
MLGAYDNGQVGAAVGQAGDMNNDGYADLIVGTTRSGDVQYLSYLQYCRCSCMHVLSQDPKRK